MHATRAPASGAFNEAQNVSVGGNTVWVVQIDDDGAPTGVRSIPLGDCDPARARPTLMDAR